MWLFKVFFCLFIAKMFSHGHNLQNKLFVHPVLKYNSSIWSPHLVKDITAIEHIQKYFIKNLKGLKNMSYSEHLTALNRPSLSSHCNSMD